MRIDRNGFAFAVLVAAIAAEACAPSVVFDPQKGAGGSGGEVSSTGTSVSHVSSSAATSTNGPSTGSGAMCGSLVGPSVPASCTMCIGAACPLNGCLGGDWCDTGSLACVPAPTCLVDSTTGSGGASPATNATVTAVTSSSVSTGSEGPDGGPSCVQHCEEIVANPVASPCPGSTAEVLYQRVVACICRPENCGDICGAACPNISLLPSNACVNCAGAIALLPGAACSAEFTACTNDAPPGP